MARSRSGSSLGPAASIARSFLSAMVYETVSYSITNAERNETVSYTKAASWAYTPTGSAGDNAADRREQAVLVSEVDVDQAFVGAGALGDAIDARAGQAVLGELLGGRAQQAGLGRPGVAGAGLDRRWEFGPRGLAGHGVHRSLRLRT